MNRRNFLKSIAAVAAGAVAIPTAAKKLPWTSYSMTYKFKQARDNTRYTSSNRRVFTEHLTPSGGGVTLEQALELARMTLKDMPTGTIEFVGGLSC